MVIHIPVSYHDSPSVGTKGKIDNKPFKDHKYTAGSCICRHADYEFRHYLLFTRCSCRELDSSAELMELVFSLPQAAGKKGVKFWIQTRSPTRMSPFPSSPLHVSVFSLSVFSANLHDKNCACWITEFIHHL